MRTQLFQKIISVILKDNKEIIENCKEDQNSRKIFLFDFIKIISFTFIKVIGSLRLTVTELQNNTLGIKNIPFSTLKDCFSRFNYETFRTIFLNLVSTLSLIAVPELALFGKICLVDGSIFPVSIRVDWAFFRKEKRAVKLHLVWNLNNMLVEDMSITHAKENERKVLKTFIRSAVTYIIDRGYVSFNLFSSIISNNAHFVCRLKKTALYKVIENKTIVLKSGKQIKDMLVFFHNSKDKQVYRLIQFKLFKKRFLLLTDRKDIKAEEIIMLYASRWQIELVFRFMKRTLKGIHIYNESENGLYIQFYMIAIISLLLMALKQECLQKSGYCVQPIILSDLLDNPVTVYGKRLKQFWKIGIHWITKLIRLLDSPFNSQTIKELASC